MSQLDLLLPRGGGPGWGPVDRLVELMERYFYGTSHNIEYHSGTDHRYAIASLVPRRRGGQTNLLVLAPMPSQLNMALATSLQSRYGSVTGWVIDSFQADYIPRCAKSSRTFDWIYVTDSADAKMWSQRGVTDVRTLEWGADCLSAAHMDRGKDWDVLRVGRQPHAWDDDAIVREHMQLAGIGYHGRPAAGPLPLHAQLSRSKVIVAFSNLVSPAHYTSKTVEYLTGRWTDALAHGCLCAGVVPDTAPARHQVPDFARIDLNPLNVESSLSLLHTALDGWTPELAGRIKAHAREHTDWRYRLLDIAHDLDLPTSHLEDDIATLRALPLNP